MPRSVSILWAMIPLLRPILRETGLRLERKRRVFRANCARVLGALAADDPLRAWLELPEETRYAALVRNMADDLATLVDGDLRRLEETDPGSRSALERLRGGGLLLSAHFGNHELVARGCAEAGMRILSSAQTQKSRLAQRLLDRRRALWNAPAADFSGRLFEAASRVERGGVVGVMMDQDPGPRGADDRFFSLPCRTTRLADALWRRAGRPPVVFGLAMTGAAARWRVVYAAGEESEAPSDLARRTTERAVRERPDLWYGWIHRRFKSVAREIYGP